jgi:hypothetical protein
MNCLYKNIRATFLCFLAIFCAALSSEEKRKIAILEPFGREPVTQMNKVNARGAITESVSAADTFSEIDWAEIDKIFAEGGFQRLDLNNSAKARQLGKLAEADLIWVTDIYRSKGKANANCTLIDAATGEVLCFASESSADDTEQAFKKAMEALAAKTLAAWGSGKRPSRVIAPRAESKHDEHRAGQHVGHSEGHSESGHGEKSGSHHGPSSEIGSRHGIIVGRAMPTGKNSKHADDVTSLGLFVEKTWHKNSVRAALSVDLPIEKTEEGVFLEHGMPEVYYYKINIKSYSLGVDWLAGFMSSDKGPYMRFGFAYSLAETKFKGYRPEEDDEESESSPTASTASLGIGLGYRFGKHFFIEAGYGVPVYCSEDGVKLKDMPHSIRVSAGVRF